MVIKNNNFGYGFLSPLFILSLSLFSEIALAEEGGSGHYLPGSMSSFVDGVPSAPTIIARLNVISYDGSFDRNIPIAGQVVATARATSTAIGATFLWAPDWDIGEKWSFAMSTTIPLVTIEVSGTVAGLSKVDDETGIGDVILMPLMFNYQHNKDLNSNYRLAVYVPTGSYTVGKLANTGKNFWSVEPTAALMYFGQENGIEASVFLGATFNTENTDTHYKSGTQAHIDGTLAQHFPMWGGLAGVGVTGFIYDQISADSGSGANFGDFKAHDSGFGPALSWVSKVNGVDLLAELKYLKESNVKDRLKGDTLFLKVVGKF